MSFGKRGPGDEHPARKLIPPQPVASSTSAEPAPVARVKSADPGVLDKGFIALALGVVVVSAGGTIAAPSVMSMLSGQKVRPIAEIVAGLDRDHAKAALAQEAFPDAEGRAFMTALATNFPDDHDRLVGHLADLALTGADRDDFIKTYSEWTLEFAMPNFGAMGRSGAEGFDAAMGLVTDALGVVEKAAGGCTLAAFEKMASNPAAFADISAYGSDGYKVGMKAGRALVDLIARGKNAPPVATELTDADEQALSNVFLSVMMDKQVVGLMQAAAMSSSGDGSFGFGANAISPDQINVCQIANVVIVKLRDLPADTKGRIWSMGASNAGLLFSGGPDALMSSLPGGFPGGFSGTLPSMNPSDFR